MTSVPADTPKPRKKAAADARQAEADGFAQIEQNGVTLRIPVGRKVPLLAYRAFRAGDEMLGTELLLGEEQWEAFVATNPTVGDFEEIGTKLSEVLGN